MPSWLIGKLIDWLLNWWIANLIVDLLIDWLALSGNIALYQPAESSSTDHASSVASRAVDGNPRSVYPYGLTTQWSTDPWWRVDLGMSYIIDDMYIIGRSECCWDRINGAQVTVGTIRCPCSQLSRVYLIDIVHLLD